MNIAGKGVLLIIAVITVGIIVLNQGFDKNTSATSEPVPSPQESENTEKKSQEIEQQTETTEEEASEDNSGGVKVSNPSSVKYYGRKVMP